MLFISIKNVIYSLQDLCVKNFFSSKRR